MSLVREADAWLGKTLFIPIIIRVCQLTGQTQLDFSRALWMATGLYALAFGSGPINRLVLPAACFLVAIASARRALTPSSMFLLTRLMWWADLVHDVTLWALAGQDRLIGADVMVLFAEYAMTITTIPPSEAKRWKTKARAAQ